MKGLPIRLLIGGAIVAAAGAFVLSGRSAPETPVAAAAPPEPVAPPERVDSIGSDELLTTVVERLGLEPGEAVRLFADLTHLDPHRVRAGTRVTATLDRDTTVRALTFHLAVDSVIRFTRETAGWAESVERVTWTVDTVVVGGRVATTLGDALVRGATAFPESRRLELAYGIADLLEYRIDLSRDLRVDDTLSALVERETAPGGHVRLGKVLAARGSLGGIDLEAVRFEDEEGRDMYYDAEGKSLRAAFLRAPLAYRRISSVFGRRRHPILKRWRSHTGIDYAAARGTPVRAVGNGRVIFVGSRGGYGRTVEIRHANGFVTRYAHLDGFARGIKRGAAVSISNTIGFVGSSGLATGPHLHFEVLVGGVHKDPRRVFRNVGGDPVPKARRTDYERHRLAVLGELDARVFALQQGAGDATDAPGRRAAPLPGGPRAVGAGN